jgi:hypothetical protein
MEKRILIHTFEISEFDQRVNFQINLPRDVTKITSVHHSLILITDEADAIPENKDGSYYSRTVVFGDLRLQSFEKAGWFYTGEVTLHDRNLIWGDASIITLDFLPNPATHSLSNFSPVSVMVDAHKSTVINGYYVDRMGTQIDSDITYKVRVYIEVELQNCKS